MICANLATSAHGERATTTTNRPVPLALNGVHWHYVACAAADPDDRRPSAVAMCSLPNCHFYLLTVLWVFPDSVANALALSKGDDNFLWSNWLSVCRFSLSGHRDAVPLWRPDNVRQPPMRPPNLMHSVATATNHSDAFAVHFVWPRKIFSNTYRTPDKWATK